MFIFYFKINFKHSHQIDNAEAYSYLRVSPEVQNNFISYFNNGMTPALSNHITKL